MMEQKLPIDALNGWYKELAELTSIEISCAVYQRFQGLTVNFPTRFVSVAYLKKCLSQQLQKEGFLTRTQIQLYTTHFHYSERHIRRLIKGIEKETTQKQ